MTEEEAAEKTRAMNIMDDRGDLIDYRLMAKKAAKEASRIPSAPLWTAPGKIL